MSSSLGVGNLMSMGLSPEHVFKHAVQYCTTYTPHLSYKDKCAMVALHRQAMPAAGEENSLLFAIDEEDWMRDWDQIREMPPAEAMREFSARLSSKSEHFSLWMSDLYAGNRSAQEQLLKSPGTLGSKPDSIDLNSYKRPSHIQIVQSPNVASKSNRTIEDVIKNARDTENPSPDPTADSEGESGDMTTAATGTQPGYLWCKRSQAAEFMRSLREEPDARLLISPGESITIKVPVYPDVQILYWEFATERYDIGFGAELELCTDQPTENRPESIQIIPKERRLCCEDVIVGCHRASSAAELRTQRTYYLRSTPLSQDESPGPSHYTPLLTLVSPSTPKFSMLGRDSIAALPHTLPYPSPADRDIRLDPLRVGTKFASQKGKGTTWPYAPRKNPHITPSPGPNINLHHNDVGTSQQRASISSRNRSGVLLGHPGTFAQPVDSHGFQTPGPAVYTPHPLDSLSGLKQSIGRKLAGESSETCVPGAGTYEIASSFDSTAGHCFGGHLQALTMDTKPAPNSYCLPSTNNKNISYSLRARNEPVLRIITPAPNRYQLSSVDDTGGKYSRCAGLQYRAFEPELARAPTAASYDNSCCPFAIDSSPIHASRCPPGYPDVLHYPEFCTLSTPSPAAYHPSISITRPLDPCYSFGSPFSHPISLIPSPNKYDTRAVKTSRHAHTCSYSIRPKTVGVSADNPAMLPGPSDYSPKEAKRSSPVHSFGVKHSHTDKLDPTSPSLSPTSYHIPNNLTHRGIMQSPSYSFKGMLSPRVYNGFSNSSILAKLSTIC